MKSNRKKSGVSPPNSAILESPTPPFEKLSTIDKNSGGAIKHQKPMQRTKVDYKKLLREEERMTKEKTDDLQMQINGLKIETERINTVMNIMYKDLEKLKKEVKE